MSFFCTCFSFKIFLANSFVKIERTNETFEDTFLEAQRRAFKKAKIIAIEKLSVSRLNGFSPSLSDNFSKQLHRNLQFASLLIIRVALFCLAKVCVTRWRRVVSGQNKDKSIPLPHKPFINYIRIAIVDLPSWLAFDVGALSVENYFCDLDANLVPDTCWLFRDSASRTRSLLLSVAKMHSTTFRQLLCVCKACK